MVQFICVRVTQCMRLAVKKAALSLAFRLLPIRPVTATGTSVMDVSSMDKDYPAPLGGSVLSQGNIH